MRVIDDVHLDDLVRQQTDRPAGISRWRRPAGQRNQLGLGFAIENRLDRWPRALLAGQHCGEPFIHQLGTRPGNHDDVGLQRLADAFIGPALAIRTLIGLQQNARFQDRLGQRLSLGNNLP